MFHSVNRSYGRLRPPLGAQVDSGHALASQLTQVWLFNHSAVKSFLSFDSIRGASGKFTLQTANSGITDSADLNGTALHLGSGASTGVGFIAGNTSISTPYTMAARIELDSTTGYQGLFVEATSHGWFLNSGKLDWYKIADHNGTTTLSTYLPYMLVATNDGTTITMYINGLVDATITLTDTSFNITSLLGDSSSEYLHGWVDSLYLWQGRALTTGEISWLYQEPYAMFSPPLTSRAWFFPPASDPALTVFFPGWLGEDGYPRFTNRFGRKQVNEVSDPTAKGFLDEVQFRMNLNSSEPVSPGRRLPRGVERFDVLQTPLDLTTPGQFGWFISPEPAVKPIQRRLTAEQFSIPQTTLDITEPAQFGWEVQLPDRTIKARSRDPGQEMRHANPYLDVPPPGWLVYEEFSRHKVWLRVVAPSLAQHLADPLPTVSPPSFGFTNADRVRRDKQLTGFHGTLELSMTQPLQIPPMQPWDEPTGGLPAKPRPAGEARPSFVAMLAQDNPYTSWDQPTFQPRGSWRALAQSDALALIVSPTVTMDPLIEWQPPAEPRMRKPRPTLEPSQVSLPSPIIQDQTDLHGWDIPPQIPLRVRQQGPPAEDLYFFVIRTAEMQCGWQIPVADRPWAPARPGLGFDSPALTTPGTVGTDAAVLGVWNVPAQMPRFVRGMLPGQAAESLPLLYGLSLIVSGPFFVPQGQVYFAGGFQADIRELEV